MKQLTKMIGSLTAKFAALLLTLGLAGGAWGAVAKIGTTEYDTLAAAVAAAQTGQTIEMLGDTTVGAEVAISKAITIDLKGHTITSTHAGSGTSAFFVSGALTIDDSSAEKTGAINAAAYQAIRITSAGRVTISGGTITNNGFCIADSGVLNVTGGNVVSLTSYAVNVVTATAKANISGGTVKSNKSVALYNMGITTISGEGVVEAVNSTGIANEKTLILSGGTIKAKGVGVINGDPTSSKTATGTVTVSGTSSVTAGSNGIENRNGTVTIEGGTITSTSQAGVVNTKNSAILNVSGGNINSNASSGINMIAGNATVTGGKIRGVNPISRSNGTIAVSGGIFSANPALYVAEGYVATENTDESTKVAYPWMVAESVAKIGGKSYAAVAAVNNNEVITLIADSATADADNGKTFTIAMNGHKLTGITWVTNGTTLTIDGSVEGSAYEGSVYVGYATNNNGNVVLNGGTYTCGSGNTVLHINGTCLDSDVTIRNAKITSPDDNGIQLNGSGTFVIENSEITGATGVYVKSGDLTITNSKITGNLNPANYSYNGNGANATGDAIVIDSCNYPGGAPVVSIGEGNTLSGTKKQVGYYEALGGGTELTSGTVTAKSADATVPDGYTWVADGDVYRLTPVYTVTWKNGDATLETDTGVVKGAHPSYDSEVVPTKAPSGTDGDRDGGRDVLRDLLHHRERGEDRRQVLRDARGGRRGRSCQRHSDDHHGARGRSAHRVCGIPS